MWWRGLFPLQRAQGRHHIIPIVKSEHAARDCVSTSPYRAVKQYMNREPGTLWVNY
jgi:hypothetical protein